MKTAAVLNVCVLMHKDEKRLHFTAEERNISVISQQHYSEHIADINIFACYLNLSDVSVWAKLEKKNWVVVRWINLIWKDESSLK